MLRKFVGAAVALVIVSSLGLAQEGGGGTKHTVTVGKITKIDFEKGILTIKKEQDSSSGNLICTLTKNTKFTSIQWSGSTGEAATKALKELTNKDEIKNLFKVGTKVHIVLDADGKTVITLRRAGSQGGLSKNAEKS